MVDIHLYADHSIRGDVAREPDSGLARGIGAVGRGVRIHSLSVAAACTAIAIYLASSGRGSGGERVLWLNAGRLVDPLDPDFLVALAGLRIVV